MSLQAAGHVHWPVLALNGETVYKPVISKKLRLLCRVYGFDVLYKWGDDGGTPGASDIGRSEKNEPPQHAAGE
jgi:hypothetical protein